MKELLSNEEIDTLLELFRAESSAAPRVVEPEFKVTNPVTSSVSPLDLLKPNRFGRERLQMLERLFSTAAKSAATLLVERLRIDVSCDCVAVEQMRFASWRRQLDGPAGVWTFAVEPFTSPVFMTLAAGLVRGVVDRLLGGSGGQRDTSELLTAAELAVAEALVVPIFERFAATLRDVVVLRHRVETRSGSPAAVPAMAPSDVVLSVYFQIGGDVLQGDLRLAIAYHDLEPFLDALAEGVGGAAAAPAVGVRVGAVPGSLRDVPLGLRVVLGRASLSLESMLGLRVGDVVRLDRIAGELFDVDVEGHCKLRGAVERRGKARTFRVVERVMPSCADARGLGESADDDV